MTVAQIRKERAKLVADARAILDKADAANREMNGEEKTSYEAIMADVDKKQIEIDQRSKLEDAEADLKKSQGRSAGDADPPIEGGKKKQEVRSIDWGDNFRTARSLPLSGVAGDDEYRACYSRYLASANANEFRALQADLPTVGGYLITPQQMVAGLLKFVDNAVFIRQKATVTQVPTAASLGIVSLDADPADSTWTSELAAGSEDSTMTFGKRELHPHPLAKYIKVSNKLIRMATNVESIVTARLGYKQAVTEEQAFMTGTGANQPLGLFTASALGISTSRDVSTDNTTTTITADGLINAKYAVKGQYQKTAEWVFHRDAIKMIRKLKDGNGQYLWLPGLGGTPDNLLDRPVNISEYASNTFTTGLYVGIFGDLSFYHIAESLQMTIQVVDQLYAATNQTGYFLRSELDGMPVLEEAFARVKLA